MTRHPRKLAWRCAILAAVFGAWLAPAASPGTIGAQELPPDLVLVLTDDQPHHTLAFMPITNQLLADGGIRFDNGIANSPLCCPARATLLTGLYSHNHGVLDNVFPDGGAQSFDDRFSLAVLLQAAGYRTGLFGKYLNSYKKLQPWPYVPPGWTEWRVFKEPDYFGRVLVENGTEVRYPASSYSTSRLAAMVVDFISSTRTDQPLFAMYAPFAPHKPALPAPADEDAFPGLDPFRPPSFNEADVSDKPRWVKLLPLLTSSRQQEIDALYGGVVRSLQAVDRAVGDIVEALEERGRPYVIVFTSDNGVSLGAHRWEEKECVYEECIHVPFLVRGTGIVPRVDARLVQHVDLGPTFLELAGLEPPAVLDGSSFADRLFDDQLPGPDAVYVEMLFDGSPSKRSFEGVRTERYLYAEYGNGNKELYDLEEDPFQLRNRVNRPAFASLRQQLAARLEDFRE